LEFGGGEEWVGAVGCAGRVAVQGEDVMRVGVYLLETVFVSIGNKHLHRPTTGVGRL
jgi:hypothetical protein